MRIFIALEMPGNIKKALGEVQKQLEPALPHAKWVKPENIHLTLSFLGEIESEKIETIKGVILVVAKEFKAITTNVNKFGFFPNNKFPKVFFSGLNNDDKITAIATALKSELVKLGFTDEHKFTSHVTMARFKEPISVNLGIFKDVMLPQNKFDLQEIAIFESSLTKAGPVYKKLFKALLGK
jgi:2'-5' RNA ligase